MGNYFKSSLSFVNKYINLKNFYQLKSQNTILRQFLAEINSKKYGQEKIEMGLQKKEENQKKRGKDKNSPAREVSAQEIKAELKRIQSRSPHISKSRSRIWR